jgi:hypothetical protein
VDQNENKGATEEHEALTDMTTIRQIKTIATRAQDTLLQDAIGMAALVVMLFVGLSLPSFV